MGMVKESLFDVLEVALASLEGIGRAWEKGAFAICLEYSSE